MHLQQRRVSLRDIFVVQSMVSTVCHPLLLRGLYDAMHLISHDDMLFYLRPSGLFIPSKVNSFNSAYY